MSEVFDISAYHATGGTLAKYTDLTAALDSNNGGGVPQSFQKGGMSIKFVQSSDNKYVQFRLMSDTFNTTESDWQGVVNEIKIESDDLVNGGGIEKVISIDIPFSVAKTMLNLDGTEHTNNEFDATDYIPVKEGYIIGYKGYAGKTSYFAAVCGYDYNKLNPVILFIGSTKTNQIPVNITIPSGVAYIRAAAANSNNAYYQGRKVCYINSPALLADEIEKEKSERNAENTVLEDKLFQEQQISKEIVPVDDRGQYVQGFISNNKEVGETVDLNVIDNPNYVCCVLECQENDVISINGSGGDLDSGSNILYTFLDNENKVVARTPIKYTSINEIKQVTTPAGVSKIVFNSSKLTRKQFCCYKGVSSIQELKNIRGNYVEPYQNAYLTAVGQAVGNAKFDTSDFVRVQKGDIIFYKGYMGGTLNAAVCGYDENKNFVGVIVPSGGNKETSVVIGIDVAYVRFSSANSGHSSYNGSYWRILSVYDLISKTCDAVAKENGYKTLFRTSAGTSTWITLAENDEKLVAGKYRIKTSRSTIGITLYAGYGTTFPTVRTVNDYTVDNGFITFTITPSDVESGATWIRINTIELDDVFVMSDEFSLDNRPLKGKKIAVIGDSISTIFEQNTPYWTVKSVDVGNEISSYITYYDVYDTQGNPTNKTIGGIQLTDAMIGTLQTFTPIAEDVDKEIGVPLNYNQSFTKVWSKVFCDITGAELLANASWSGASMCSGQAGSTYLLSHAYSDYTIGRCHVRDEEGNVVNPDIIFVYRGTNDLSHKHGTNYSMLDNYEIGASGYPMTDEYVEDNVTCYGFRRAYYLTIKKLREAYPKAMIVCCTLNVFKRILYDRFPTRNGQYTLPQMNNVIREIANEMGCQVVEFDKDGITFENCYDGGYIRDNGDHPTHPSSKGHTVMGRKAASDVRFSLS